MTATILTKYCVIVVSDYYGKFQHEGVIPGEENTSLRWYPKLRQLDAKFTETIAFFYVFSSIQN